jgi:hypothetical protein
MANPDTTQPSFALITNGDDSVFAKLTQTGGAQYSVSRVFAALTAQPELDRVLQILKRIAQSQPVQP